MRKSACECRFVQQNAYCEKGQDGNLKSLIDVNKLDPRFLFYFIMWSLFCCFLEPTTWKHADTLPGTRCDTNPARKHIVCKSLYNKSLTKEKKINGAVLSVCYISYTQLMYHYWLSEDQM